MSYEALTSINMQAGLDVSSAPLSQASQNALGDGSWNAIVSGNGLIRPWLGPTAQSAGSGSYKMMPFGNTWGGIKSFTYASKDFEAGTAAVQTNYLAIAGHGFVTGLEVVVTSDNPPTTILPTGLTEGGTYYVIYLTSTNFSLATSLTLAIAGTATPITAASGTGDCTIVPSPVGSVTASGNWFQDIGQSRWGIGSGQAMIAGVGVPGYYLTTNLQVQIPVSGVFGTPVQAGLSQPSAPGLGIINTVGTVSNSVSAKIARSRPSTGAVSVASPTSAVINPQANQVRVTFPVAATGQTHWRVYFTQQGFGGTGIHYLAEYTAGETDIPEATIAAGSAAGSRATGTLTFNSQPAIAETIDINGVTYTFIAGASSGTDVNRGVDADTAAASLVAVLNASANVLINVATYTVVTNVVTITYDTDGTAGNGFDIFNSSGTAVTASGATLTGGVDGISRSLVFNYKDGDLVPLEASYDNYPPPAATHAIRLNTVMNLPGCYSDSTSDPSSSSTGTAIAVSKENDYESYVPTSLLYLPEQVVDVLARPIDDYGYVGCTNSVHAIQYVGNRGDELPSCTITTVLPDIGVQYPHNWCAFQGKLLLMPAPGVLLLMDEAGGFDATFANPVTAILKTFSLEETSVGYDPSNDSIVVMNDKTILVYSRQAGVWRQIWLPDFRSTKAAGSYTFTVNPSAGTTFLVNGTSFEIVAGVPVGNQIREQPTLALTMASIVAALNASAVPGVAEATYSTPSAGATGELTIVHDTAGTDGNAFTLGTSTGTIVRSATTLLGGAAGADGSCLPSCTVSGGVLYFSMTSGGVETAYTYDTGSAVTPISFVCNPQNAGGVVVNDIYEMAVSAWTTVSTQLGVAINKNLTQTAFRAVVATANSADLTCKGFDATMIGKKFILFGPDLAGYGSILARGTVLSFNGVLTITTDTVMTASATNLLMFVGDFTAAPAMLGAQHLPNFFPNMPELRSFQVATWLQATGDAGNVLTVDLIGNTYASSRAL